MEIKEQVIHDMAFRMYWDAVYGIRPASKNAAMRWLQLARSWAIRNKCYKLATQITAYLMADTTPHSETADLQRPSPAIAA